MKVIILGPPGTGKDVQANKLAFRYKIPAVSIGKILRKEVRLKSKEGKILSKYLRSGDLAPDTLVNKVLQKRLKKTYNNKRGFILNGFPRSISQINQVKNIGVVIYLNTSKKELVRRLHKRHRSDDKRKLVNHRIKVYKKWTEPVLNYYKKKKLVIIVDGNNSINNVHKEIIKKLNLYNEKNG